jgi:hypothetical protein
MRGFEKMIRDEPIVLIVGGVRLEGRLVRASPNRRSLCVEVPGMPRMELLAMTDAPDGNYRDVFTGRHVKVEVGPAARGPGN